jgi:hypothetical protein
MDGGRFRSPRAGGFAVISLPIMLRWLLFFFALLAVGLGLLTTIQSPAWLDWRLAIVAGEFGYWLAVGCLGIALLAWLSRGRRKLLGFVTVLTCGVAMGLLLKPCIEAWQIGLTLRDRLEADPSRPRRRRGNLHPG